jgi:hypothetical protein
MGTYKFKFGTRRSRRLAKIRMSRIFGMDKRKREKYLEQAGSRAGI